MPVPVPHGLQLGVAEPRDALRRFESRQLLLPTFRWQDAWQAEHARGFAVAGVTKLSVLDEVYRELASGLAVGRSPADFAARIRPALQAKGYWGDVTVKDPVTGATRVTRFDDARLRLIYDTNLRQSHAAGRWDRIQANKKRQPFVMYRTMDDGRVRAAHKAWHNLVLPVDHPFWHEHFPPNGWRCRCTAFGVTERDIERRIAAGQKINREAPPEQWVNYRNPHTGEVRAVPRGIDPGFGHNPGREELDGVLPKALRESGFRVADFSPELDTTPLPAARERPATLVMEPGLPAGQYVDAFMGAFGARRDASGAWLPTTFIDAAGEDIVVAPSMFADRATGAAKLLKRERERFVQVLAEAIKEPDEIWLAPMYTQDGRIVVRRRYLVRFAIAGAEQPMIGVFEWGRDGWQGVTGFNADDMDYLLNQRRGYLAYRRREPAK